MNDVTIYHNPACSKSRATLALIKEHGFEPVVIEYLKNPPSRSELMQLLDDMQLSVRDLIRPNEEVYQTLELDDDKWGDKQLIDVMTQYPNLINRPIVVTRCGTLLCRPPERVLTILPK